MSRPLTAVLGVWFLLSACDGSEVASSTADGPGRDGAAAGADGKPTDSDAKVPPVGDANSTGTSKPDTSREVPGPSLKPPQSCPGMFGLPTASTGLDEATCKPVCDCEDAVFRPPNYSEADIARLEAWTLVEPPSELVSNPYDDPSAFPDRSSEVCALMRDRTQVMAYRLRTFASAQAAQAAGGIVTHSRACGLCSTLKDLAVYIRQPDLTTPVRKCGLDHFAGPKDAHIRCLQDLGFELPCAQIWYYNTVNTRKDCLVPCIGGLGATYHKPDGSLNDCIQCDEDKSGPVFQAVAGRTRRNSGVPSGLCRPCNTVSRIVHDYPSR